MTSESVVTESATADSPKLPSPTRRNVLWYSAQVVVRALFAVWLRYRARGAEKIPSSGGGLILANHQSFLDPLLIGLPLSRPISYVARDSLFRVPVLGWILRKTYVMPISREAASSSSIKKAVQFMQHGFLVGIFPEGTRSDDGTVGEFKPGFVALVRRARLPVYPVGIAGAGRALPRRALFLRPSPVCVVFGEPFTVEELDALCQKGNEAEFVRQAQTRVTHCQQDAEAWLVQCRGAGQTKA